MSRGNSKLPKRVRTKSTNPLNPYFFAVFTATLAGIFSVVGGCFTAEFQAKQAIVQKRNDYRVMAYTGFLDRTDRSKPPAISQLLSIGSMADHLVTDGEIQAFEDRIASLLKKYDVQDIYWQLNADLNILRLHGSSRVSEICDDILKSLLLRDSEINWAAYPQNIVAFHDVWKIAEEKGTADAWEERVTSDERLMIVTISKLTQVLIEQLRAEIHSTTT
jgi:hypothetical protein